MTDEDLFRMMLTAVRAGAGELAGESGDSCSDWRRDWQALPESSPEGELLIRSMSGHRCLPLVLKGLLAGSDFPVSIVNRLRRVQASLLARSVYLTMQLSGLLERFGRERLRVMPFKGPAMAQYLYGDPALRPSDDLDIWVHPDDFMQACAVLEQGGFVPQLDLTNAEARDHVRAGWDRAYRNPAGDLVVELCTGVCPAYFSQGIRADEVLRDPVPVVLNGMAIQMPSPEVSLLWLSIHGSKHAWSRLIWLADMHLLLSRNPKMDWNRVRALADECGASGMVVCAVEMTRCIFPGLDTGFSVAPTTRKRACLALEWIQENVLVLFPPTLGWRDETRLQWLLRDRWRDRWRYSLISLLTPGYNDWKVLPLPSGLRGLYWAIRPLRLVFRR